MTRCDKDALVSDDNRNLDCLKGARVLKNALSDHENATLNKKCRRERFLMITRLMEINADV